MRKIAMPPSRARLLAPLALALALGVPGALRAGTNLNEVGAVLVYPVVVGVPGQETFLTLTNAGASSVVAHISYINGDATPIGAGGAGYCQECDFDVLLSGNDTETFVIRSTANGIAVEAEDSSLSLSCPFPFGMVVVTLQNGAGETLTDNVLLGEEVVVDYEAGTAYSIAAIPFQGRNGGNGDRHLSFDDQEYGKLPRIVAANFIAPDLASQPNPVTAELVLFTPGFERQFPPLTDCSVTGYDADENPFSSSFQFGCWTAVDLCAISPEFCYPNLGLFGNFDNHGWLLLNCRVDQDRNGTFDAAGGVHGAILQTAAGESVLRRNDAGAPALTSAASWARLLHQSVTTGDPLTLILGGEGAGLD
jgi:hypothetical protein